MSGTERAFSLLELPTEILVHILTPFATHDLLRLTLICTKIHNVVLRLLHYRLLLAADAPEYQIILEAYHPSRRYVRPYLHCRYLGTDGLSSKHEGEGSLYHDCEGVAGRLGKLGALYSRFRPENPTVEGKMPVRRLAGAIPASALPANGAAVDPNNLPTTPIYGNEGDGGAQKVVYTINLDADELFGQFCAYGQLVRLTQRRGVYLSSVNIVEANEGIIRVWRPWLLDRGRELYEAERKGALPKLERSSTTVCPAFRTDPTILWTDARKNVGLKVAVRFRDERFYGDQDLDNETLSCDLEIQELIVRTTHLMLAVERSVEAQERNGGKGRALIFGNFASIAS